MKKLILSLFLFSFLVAENSSDYSYVFDRMTNHGEYLSSSFLIDEKYSKDRYSPDKAFDGNENTAWVVSTDKSGVGEYIYVWISIDNEGAYDFPKKSKLKIKNGLFANKNLYYANNRLKNAKFEIYECDVIYGLHPKGAPLRNYPVLNKVIKLNFKDEMVEHQFDIVIEKPKPQVKSETHSYFYFGKLIITEIYKGSKYNDTCISEIETDSIPR